MISWRDQKEVRYGAQCIYAILAARLGLSEAQHIAKARRHNMVVQAGELLEKTLGLGTMGNESGPSDVRHGLIWIQLLKRFSCVDSRLEELLAQALIAQDPLRPEGLSYGTGPPVSFKELDYSELYGMDNQTKTNTQERQDGNAPDTDVLKGRKGVTPVWRMPPAAGRDK